MTEVVIGSIVPIEVTVEFPVINVDVSANLPGTSTGAEALDDLTDVDTTTTAPALDDALVFNGSIWVPGAVEGQDEVWVGPTPPPTPFDGQLWIDTTGAGAPPVVPPVTGVTDHGALTGLTDDDHTQYYNQARGDARYSLSSHAHAHSTLTGLDTDSAATALHHTLGGGAFQAAAGNHTHAATAGAIILFGTATPTGAVGNSGEWYLDTDNNILYGPKSGTTWPVAVFGVPTGGGTDQVLAKVNTVDYQLKWATVAAGGGGSSFTRSLTGVTTASLATNASEQTSITLANSYRIRHMSVTRPCRVRVYDLATHQATDLTRAIGTDPTNDHGVLLDMVFTTDVKYVTLSPQVDGHDGRGTPTGVIPVTVTNLDTTTGTCQVDFSWIRTE